MYRYKATIKRIINGDTLVVDIELGLGIDARKKHIRLKGINAPEIKTDEGKTAKKKAGRVVAHRGT